MKRDPLVYIFEPRIDYLNLYCLNLQVYVNAQFVICNRFEDLINEIKKGQPDLVFACLVNEEKPLDKLLRLNNALKDKFLKPLSYAQVHTNDKYSEINIYDTDIPVKDIISSVAKKLGITAKYMSELDVGPYYPIALKYILPGWQATQPIYKKIENDFVIALPKGQIFTKDFIDSMGIKNEVYCKSSYRLEVINSFTSKITSILDSNDLSITERFMQTEIAFEMVSQSVSNIGLPDSIMSLARSSIRSMENIVGGVPSLGNLYKMLLEDNKSMRFKHCIIASYLGQFVLKDQSWNNPNIQRQWSYLCFFHDIILDRDELLLYEYDDDVKASKLPDRDKSIVLNHAQMASKLISQMKDIPIGIDTLIKQHHGSKMGNSLSEISMSISPMCIIFILVENYTHFLLSDNESMKKPEEIISFIDGLFKKYPYPNYKKMIPLLRTIPFKD